MIFKDQIVEIKKVESRPGFITSDGYALKARIYLATALSEEQLSELAKRFPDSTGAALLKSFGSSVSPDMASLPKIEAVGAIPPLLYEFSAAYEQNRAEVEPFEGVVAGVARVAPSKDCDLELTWKIDAQLSPDQIADLSACQAVPPDGKSKTIARLTTALVPDKQRQLFAISNLWKIGEVAK